ncbi:hypothetical protein CSHISOI_07848 [Colletotrichum shisoi]|uniref:SUN domain-containing protein n=1 Tax=Colletotrichum shisoi TaxID=2078593 RepID=A0A5Q4BLR6_9PEZI|nr:hypothetical protein CSHISOI_07848 [Colletotrichum shisoi]
MWSHSGGYLCNRPGFFAKILAVVYAQASSQSTVTDGSLVGLQSGNCEFKTINYITHTLPQQCLRTSWPGDKVAADGPIPTNYSTRTLPKDSADQATPMPEFSATGHSETTVTASLSFEDTAIDDEPTPRPFMSFEDWKEMMLRKAGQDPLELKSRKTADRGMETDRATKNLGLDSLGDDGEIDINFDVVSEKISNIASAPQATATEVATSEQQQDPVLYDDGRTQYYRSKDAGKTCKERFSYSSFDAGATVLKTNQGAKNAKAILLENKDSYMLLECSAENKFVIVELSDDILVDTVVLANFEFFSSMIRHFRVSVSDRYPVKVDKWKDLGTFEAKNSRDIQPFLVQNPLIWAKYVRIEFLTHYGNEFYCPVSLLRVHGTRMLESWKDQETAAEDEEVVDEPLAELTGPASGNAAGESIDGQENATVAALEETAQDISSAVSADPLMPSHIFRPSEGGNPSCLRPISSVYPSITNPTGTESQRIYQNSDHVAGQVSCDTERSTDQHPQNKSTSVSAPDPRYAERHPTPSSAPALSAGAYASSANTEAKTGGPGDNTSSTKASPQATPPVRNKNNSTAAAASPTVQESFFKAVSKRLQYLESNVSLSLKYIEDQSRSLQETQLLAERKQLSRIDVFLDSLNHTVLSELRTVRQQYDQIWQSTVIALESQREQSQRETVALSSRLNILADEVVFQKRMAIVQAILLLSCLILVIFSRAMTQPILTGSFDLGRSPSLNHPLPGPTTERRLGGAYIPRYDTFGRPLDNDIPGESNPSDRSPGVRRSLPTVPARLLTPTSDTGYSRCADANVTPELLPVEEFMESDPDGSYRDSSPGSDVRSPDDEAFMAENAKLDGHRFSDEGPVESTPALEDSLLEAGSTSVHPSIHRGNLPSTIRKPLPALPEYPL